MLKQCALLLLCLYIAGPAQAGLFSDEDARKQIQQLEARLLKLESLDLDNVNKQQTRAMLDLQGQIEALNIELRKLRGQNEELAHGLQDAEKREKDFYVDLDTRVRRMESPEGGLAASGNAAPVPSSSDPLDPAVENRAFEAAYGMYRNGGYANAMKGFQDFLKKFPDSVHVPNAHYWLGNSQFELKNYKAALASYQAMLNNFPAAPRSAEAMYNLANCQVELKQPASAKKTLKQLLDQHPSGEAAVKAKKLLASIK